MTSQFMDLMKWPIYPLDLIQINVFIDTRGEQSVRPSCRRYAAVKLCYICTLMWLNSSWMSFIIKLHRKKTSWRHHNGACNCVLFPFEKRRWDNLRCACIDFTLIKYVHTPAVYYFIFNTVWTLSTRFNNRSLLEVEWHIYVSKLIIIGSDNGLVPGRRQAII